MKTENQDDVFMLPKNTKDCQQTTEARVNPSSWGSEEIDPDDT